MSRAELKTASKQQLKGNWGLAIITFLIAEALVSVWSLIGNYADSASLKIVLFLVEVIIGALISYGLAVFTLNLANMKKAAFTDLGEGFKGNVIVKCVILTIVMNIIVFIGFIIFIIPGIILSMMFSQAIYLLCEDNEKSISDCIHESVEMMKGHKWELFVLMLSFIGWIILSIITIGIGFIFLSPYMSLTFANYHLKLISENSKETV